MPKLYKVGGCIRDKFLGVNSKDIDFTFVLDDLTGTVEDGFKRMEKYMEDEGYEIFVSTPEMYTIRAKFPKTHQYAGLDADFVMARREVGYVEGTRRPILELGTLLDDLTRRDFTVNAMAENEDGVLIDPFNGLGDLKAGVLITPIDPKITMLDDPLRILRALRFSITKDLKIVHSLWEAFAQPEILSKLSLTVSQERIREEIEKMFKFDSVKSLLLLYKVNDTIPGFLDIVFQNDMWLKPTFKKIKKNRKK